MPEGIAASATSAVGTTADGGGAELRPGRSVFAVRGIRAGEGFEVDVNVAALRVDGGLHPKHLDALAGRIAVCDVSAGTPLSWDYVRGGENCDGNGVDIGAGLVNGGSGDRGSVCAGRHGGGSSGITSDGDGRGGDAAFGDPSAVAGSTVATTNTASGRSVGGLRVLITGGTGTVGNALVPRLVRLTPPPAEVVVFSRCELKQTQMQQRLRLRGMDARVRFAIGDVRDAPGLRLALRGMDVVIHAAALKHVPVVEANPRQGYLTNVAGTHNVVDAAVEAGVGRVLFVGTDKAVQPLSAYGATKMLAERIALAAAAATAAGRTQTVVAACRFGNIFGSTGSIVPVVRDLLRSGSEVMLTVTDRGMTRFTMRASHAAEMLLRALDLMTGGETFVPKLPAYRLGTLLEAMGVPKESQRLVGKRPGERMHERLIDDAEAHRTVDCGDFYAVLAQGMPLPRPPADVDSGSSGDPTQRLLSVDELRAEYHAWRQAEGLTS